jgi:ABC-type multidrug transport system ATPase subunit
LADATCPATGSRHAANAVVEHLWENEGEITMLGSRGAAAAAVSRPAGQLLRATGVGKKIDEAVLLLPTNVELGAARCVVLRGPNGSGKTTLLRILAGTLPPSEGEATLDGSPVDERHEATRTAIAALIGAPATYRDLTLVDHLVLIDSTWGHAGPRADERSDEILELLEIDHLAERFPHELSSGQQQLFHLSMVLVRPSSILILDEPEQRLDTDKRGLLTQILLDRKADGSSLVVACHDPAMTEALADTIVDIQPA